MATVWRFRRGFTSISVFPYRAFLKMVTDHRLYEEKISNFQALLEVSYWQEMSLFMDDLRTSNFPVFMRVGAR